MKTHRSTSISSPLNPCPARTRAPARVEDARERAGLVIHYGFFAVRGLVVVFLSAGAVAPLISPVYRTRGELET